MNFTLKIVERGRAGVQLQNGTWTGEIGKLQRKEIDIAAMWFSKTPERFEVVDFPFRRSTSKKYLFVKRPVDAYNWTVFVEPLHWNAWLFISIMALLAPLMLYLIIR